MARWDLVREQDGIRIAQPIEAPPTIIDVPERGADLPVTLPEHAARRAAEALRDRLR